MKEDLASTLEILRQTAKGLTTTHLKGILHRDIKPSKIIVCDRSASTSLNDDRETQKVVIPVKIRDFCIARLVDYAGFLRDEEIIDSFFYMAPEQAGLLRRSIDVRSDLYSLGVLSYELLCGKLPYMGQDPRSVLHMHLSIES